MTKLLKKTLYAFLFGAGIVSACALLGRVNGESIKTFCDAFSLAGILLLCFAGLIFVGSCGGFSGVSYVFAWVKHSWLPFGKAERQSYAEFCQDKKTRGKERSIFPFLLSGGFYLLIAFLLLFL